MLLQPFADGSYNKECKKSFKKNKGLVLAGVNNATAKSFVVSDILQNEERNILWITEDFGEMMEAYLDMALWFTGQSFVWKEGMTEKESLHILVQYQKSDHAALFICEEQWITNIPLMLQIKEETQTLKVAGTNDLDELVSWLSEYGYEYSEETVLPLGGFRRKGDLLEIHPIGMNETHVIEFEFDTIQSIYTFDSVEKKKLDDKRLIDIPPAKYLEKQRPFSHIVSGKHCLILDELEDGADTILETAKPYNSIKLTAFPREAEDFIHARYLSVLKYYTLPDLLTDIRNKLQDDWKVLIYSKRETEMTNMLKEENMNFSRGDDAHASLIVLEAHEDEHMPSSFQNIEEKLLFITDKEIFSLKKASRNQSLSKMNVDFITSLSPGDFTVHFDHGIGQFQGIVKRDIEGVQREYLEIYFEGNDALYIPVDQSDKLSKYMTDDETEPRLSKLGGTEWQKQVKKIKKETEDIAKELLELYAKRASAKRQPFDVESEAEKKFAKSFPYKETPGQMKAINDVRHDMEGPQPMDRLVCGDVGFGKTEVAMRAAFKAVQSGRQVAVISPVTILTEQHYLGFKKRMDEFDIRVEMLSRFRSNAEQEEILKKLKKGDIDVVVGTHRLLQKDVEFLNLGLIIIDEEQRFGVKQKEALKNLRTQVDVLTLTATPIPRTLNLSLNKLRDITTITTPPPGRLPIITEVRKYSDSLIRDAIMKEKSRGGQIYFLHNRVETIESIAAKLRTLVPEVTFVVAHGQMSSKMLEERILAFKAGEYDVLISSTIIENGIDLANANTMIINNAEKFGLSQLYQLRGRIGRSAKQAYAYLLYHAQRLNIDAKKRLRAIVEASELGAGFQIAMRDLEIRGAGEILGASQHGAMKSVGVSHFMKLLQKTVQQMQDGTYVSEKEVQASDITIELPVSAFIPNEYITDSKEKIGVYQKLAAVHNLDLLEEFYEDIHDEYGKMPIETENLFRILRLKIFARKACIQKISTRKVGYSDKELIMVFTDACTPQIIMKALEKNPSWVISGNSLKISMSTLGEKWFTELLETVELMGTK